MGPVTGLVLFAVVWSMTFFVVLPLRISTQGERGRRIRGTHASSPEDFQLKRKLKTTTLWALPIWAVIAAVILSGVITVDDIDWFQRGGPNPAVSD